MIRNMFHRAYNNASSTSKAESGVSKIRALLLGNYVPKLQHIDVEVLYRARDHPDRKIAESLLIRQLDPRLNSNVSSWPIM